MSEAGPATGQRAIRVWGVVQEVFYRASAREEARRLGLAGWARNERDGSVGIVVEGEEAALDAFVAWCQVGPPGARVERVEVVAGAPSGLAGFVIG